MLDSGQSQTPCGDEERPHQSYGTGLIGGPVRDDSTLDNTERIHDSDSTLTVRISLTDSSNHAPARLEETRHWSFLEEKGGNHRR